MATSQINAPPHSGSAAHNGAVPTEVSVTHRERKQQALRQPTNLQQRQQRQNRRPTTKAALAVAQVWAHGGRTEITAELTAPRQQQCSNWRRRRQQQQQQQQHGSGRAAVLQHYCHNAVRRQPAGLWLWLIASLLVAAVILEDSTVLAAQRDSARETKAGLTAAAAGGNANAIPSGYAAGNGNSATSGNNNMSSGSAQAMHNNNSYTSTATTATATTTTTTVATATTTASGGGGVGGGFLSSLAKSGFPKAASAGSGSQRNAIEQMEEDVRNGDGPYFDLGASKNVTALLGKTAYLNCRVKNLGNKTMLMQVSWVRHRDIHLLTVGRYTYTSDQRFRAIHQPQTDDWVLQIKYPQHRDSGIYECQVSTTPHMSHYIHLIVVEPATEIIGAPDLYIESGSTINLTCVILNSPEPPAYIFWNHNSAIINYDSPRGGVSVVTNKGDTTTSFLLIKSARPSDSGHYQCNPSNSKPKSVTVHVLNGEYPAAMQRAAPTLSLQRMSPTQCVSVYLFICLSTLSYVRHCMRLSYAVSATN